MSSFFNAFKRFYILDFPIENVVFIIFDLDKAIHPNT